MKIRNLVGAMVALVGITFAGAALGDGGDILGVWPCDKYGTALDSPVSSPADPFNEQSRFDDGKAYFKVRFLNHNYKVTPHRWIYKKLWGSEAVVRDLAVGVLVSGVMKEAYCEGPAMAQGDRYTDFIFSYMVEPGDLALPMMLSNENGKPFGGDDAVPLKLYWTGNYAIMETDSSGEVTGETANWWWSSESSPLVPEGRNADYDLSQAGICLKTFDFDGHNAADGTWTEGQLWRSVHKGSTTTVGRFRPSISVPWSMATNSTSSASVYLWSEDESSFVVTNGGDAVRCTVREVESGVKRQVAEIKIRAGKESYEFCIYGTAEDATPRNLILSGTPNLLYAGSGALVTNFLVRTVSVAGPLPPTVSVDVGASPVTARPDYKTPVTELYVDFTQPNPAETDLDIQIVPTIRPNEEGAAGPTRPWYDYIRFGGEGTDVSLLSKNVYTNPVVRIKAGETVPTLLYPGTGPSTEMPLVGGRVCVYALYADDFSSGAKGQFEIRLDTTNLTAKAGSGSGGFDGWANGCALAVVPEVPVVTPKRASLEATQNSPVTFDLSVADLWGNLKDETGYQLYYQNRDEGIEPDEEKWQEVVAGAFWKVDAETGYLKRTKDGALVSPTITYTVPDKTYITWFCVKAPNGKSSAKDATGPNVTVKVKKAPTVTATITDEDGRTIAPSTKIDEGTLLSVNFSLDGEENTSGEKIFAFLAPVGEACGCVDGDALTNVVGAAGVEIESGASAGTFALDFTVTDGKKLSGSKLQFDIVLCSDQDGIWNPAKEVTGYQKKTVYLTVKNVIPKIKKATLDAPMNSAENGGFMKDMRGKETEVPIGLPKEFGLSVDEPGAVDSTNNFQIIWTVQEENGVVAGSTITGTKNAKIPYTFTGSGTATFTVQVRDKDMGEDEELETFYFFVNVSEKPSVTLTAPSEIGEDQRGEIAVNLSDFGTTEITGKVTVAANNTTETDIEKLGSLKLGGGALTPWRNEEGEIVPNAFAVVFKGHADQEQATKFYIDECDGTQISGDVGFTLTVEIVDTRTNAVSKTRYCDYYLPATAVIQVKNVEPQFSAFRSSKGFTADDSIEVSGNSTNVAATAGIGEKITINYSVSDIPADLVKKNIEGKVTGITITWSDSEHSYDSISVTNSTTNLVFETKFMHPGRKKIVAVLRDEDLVPYLTRTWQIDVASAKTLVTLATGPGGGIADSTLSQRYAGALGAGQGHTWANATFSFAEAFQINWNCNPDASSAAVWGFGYKVANPVDDGALDSEPKYQHDVPLSPKGNNSTESGSTELSGGYYTYKPDELYAAKLDSYLYGWISHASESDSGSGSGALTSTFRGIAPERGVTGPSSANALLPSKTDNSNGKQDPTSVVYPTTYMEAVFAREYLPSDNMGDINADGIPDLYLLVGDYDFGVVDLTTGELTGNDQRDLNFTEGEDPEPYCLDYLPTTETAVYSHLIPGLPESWGGEAGTGKPFIPRLKIRGFDETDPQSIAKRGGISASALNDAPIKWAGIAGVKPDQIYTNPREDEYSTLNYVEWLAWQEFATAQFGADAVTNKAYFTKWSPERPTNPTRKDTDGDGLTDGYEYYFWYMAHVGWVELDASGNEIHRYLTGRAYNPRNPGEGDLIDSTTLENAFDPLNGTAYKLRDTDNDGLPDELEFLIGTNPIDFDTDGDGLPDGYEVAVSYTDPLVGDDTMSNYDGDAMAFTTPALEQNGSVQPKPLHTDPLFTFALVDATGDTDGIQWYVGKSAPTNIAAVADELAGTSFTVGGRTYVTSGKVPVVTNVTVDVMGSVTNLILAADLPKKNTWSTTNAAPEGVEVAAGLIALMPTRIPAGTAVADISETTYAALGFTADVKDVNAAWVYGRRMGLVEVTDVGATPHLGFGMLAIGRYQDAKCTDVAGRKVWIAALPAKDDSVAYVHHLVYQEFGFDPRTAWRAKTPLAQRWGKTVTTGEGDTQTTVSIDGVASGFAGTATRTRAYSRYDEFLVMSFFLNNGMLAGADVTPTQAMPWREIWKKYTTNGRGPYEPYYAYSNDESEDTEKEESEDADAGKSDEDQATLENGADTDGDGVPDGWELYVMAGPKDARTGKYVFVSPLAVFGPFRDCDWAADAGATDSSAGDNDGLTELQEFAGTDSCAHYAGKFQISPDKEKKPYAYSTTIRRPLEHKYWLNKFFPTDPWEQDTDGDGLSDNATIGNSAKFLYGKDKDLVDTGKTCIPGGGLNPCSVDTDMDGLPDPWEVQFHGDHVYLGEDRQMATGIDIDHLPALAGDDGKTTVSHESSDIPLQGFCDGMDATVFDAYTTPRIVTSGSEGATTDYLVVRDGVNQVVDRDYDKDGLENWQEYLTGAMRCWRYDDPATGWGFIPDELYWFKNPLTGEYSFAPDLRALGVSSDAEFWYRTLFDRKSPIYNPHLVTGTSPSSQYFSRVKNGWDPAFTENGSYYMFYDRVNDVMIMDSWGYMAAPSKYICTSPIVADTDKDGMDDGYELFHGMNPILGASGVLQSSDGPCDIVYDAWYKLPAGSPVSALDNPWMKEIAGNGAYDFVAHPWLNGLVDADPDGDDIRNQDEAIMPLVAPQTTWYHTDPTPLWMTDSSYSDSLVNRFFRLPIALGAVSVPASIWYDADGDGEKEEIFLRDCDGYRVLPLIGPVIEPFTPDFWRLSAVDAPNWMFSFEENEGYDTDHDSTDDNEELKSKFRAATDPQDADSPRRRQAMYFPGKDAALQSMPFVHEGYPRAAMGYPDDMSFLQYTVECWVRPEAGPNGKVADATVLERTSFVDPSHCMDERYVRRNFAIQIKNGKWCTAFDSNGTLDKSVVEVVGATDVKADEWTHVAATYDATRLTLYVNGNEDGYVPSSLKPEYGASAVVVYPAGSGASKTNQLSEGSTGSLEALRGTAHAYWFDREYSLHAFLIGASFAQAADSKPLDLTQAAGWKNYYTSFFRGYVDEIRVWDGARSVDDIVADMKKRYTREDALENRNAFYKQWVRGEQRYNVGDSGEDVVPELRFHWAFDSIPGAENAAAVAQAPHGFLETAKARYSRPADYVIPWWAGILGAYGSVYAGEGNWVPWIPNTVTHLPRYDSTTLDSYYWSEDHAGDKPGVYKFARTAEPVSKWTQYVRNQTERSSEFRTTGRRFWLSHNTGTNATSTLDRQFEFTGRHLNQTGDDLIPLGGAFARYVSEMWDEQGASSMWEQTGEDADNDGLPDWWQEYFAQNFREDVPEGVDLTWDTPVWYEVGGIRMQITAGEAYHRDLAKGVYVDGNGEVRTGPTEYAQTAKSDGMIPDWWKELKKIDREEPLFDTDNDGLNNYVEYVASELLPFRLNFDPRMAKSDTKTLDYFRRVGKLYVGEMLTDHDQMEDHWERSLGDESVASAALWDALKDGEEDGWVNFAENRYNGYSMSTLAQLIAHAMGDEEVLDAPIPSLKMKVRYNGDRPLDSGEAGALPPIVVHAYSKNAETGDYVMNPDATWTVKPGEETEERSFYLGAWEDRIVRGTLAPGNVNLDSVDIKFAQVPQNDLYSWTDESGPHLAKSYKEFKEAFDKNPNIIQNIQSFQWLSLVAPANEYTSSDKAVTVTRDEKGQDNARFAVYGEPVGTINLSTGDFEFDLGAMNRLRVNYTFDSSKGSAAAWSYKEAIFKITYTAKVPSAQQKIIDFSLAKADKGFVRGGLNSIEVFYDSVNANGTWDPGEPFGVLNDVEIGWAGCELELELTDMSAVTPRVKLWGTGGEGGQTPSGGKEGQTGGRATAADSDRGVRVGTATFEAGDDARFEVGKAPASKSRVRVVRYKVDNYPVYRVGVDAGVVLEKDFEETARDFLHEGDFLADGDLDIDWKSLYTDVVDWWGVQAAACEVTNVTYLVVYNWDADSYRDDDDSNTLVRANATLVTRRFEVTRSVPTPVRQESNVTVFNTSRPTFTWKIVGEDKWASWFGTTYTAFKVCVKDLKGNLVYDSGVRRLPAKDSLGQYNWTAPLYVGEVVPETGVLFANLANYTWEVAVYNAKFSTDDLMTIQDNELVLGNPFSEPTTFRMNVTDKNENYRALAARVCYVGPATWLADRVRVQAFTSPDFTGDPAAEITLGDVSAEALSPADKTANATLIGLPEGSYFLRAYIDTNTNGVHDAWESWGYLNERDQASKPGIFNPVAAKATFNPAESNVRTILIEDCDTDGDWFPDVWEAEQNKGVFDPEVIKPVTGNAELIGVNTNLDAKLTKAMQGLGMLASADGFALLTGFNPAQVRTTVAANGATRFSVDNKVDSVTISKLEFDADGNVVISLDAKTSIGAVDPAAAAIYDLDLSKSVTCRIYRKMDLASSGWGEPVAEETVTVGAGPVTIEIAGEKTAQAYYKAEIVEK